MDNSNFWLCSVISVITSQCQTTASVTAMLAELNLQTLAERRRIARLTMFHKIHYCLIAVDMPLQSKQYTSPTRTENALAYICLWLSSVLFPKNRLGLEFRTSRSGSVEHPWSFQECPSTYSTVTTPVQPSAKVFNTEVVKLALNCKKKKKRCWSGCKQAVTLLHNSTGWNCTGQSCAVLCLFTCETIVLYCCVGVLLPEHTGSHRSVPWLNDGVCANLGIRV